MASTFSPILRIELIGTGDQSGTWGNTTNVNLGTLIEEAIAGTSTIDVTLGNVTLSNLNGSADQARCMALRTIGTPGVSRNLIAPAVSKIYIIANGSDAAVVIKTSVSTGISVPTGEVYLVYYDTTSADFRLVGRAAASANNANTLVLRDGSGNFAAGQITGSAFVGGTGTFTNLSSTGNTFIGDSAADTLTVAATPAFLVTIPVSSGGTGTTTATGTGSVVRATSPTLVTPLLGTPTSGTLTNCTDLPLTTGVTGTLPVANGGTGVTTSTGTGSVVLSTSPTLVTPLLGTPTSGTLTNCTGLPINAGTTGTLPVSRGGTGVTTSTGTGSVVLSASPALTGTPTAPTALNSDNSTTIATTAFVSNKIAAIAAGVTSFNAGTTGLTPNTDTTGAVTLGGTLAVSNGGTGTTTSTGTGSVVLSNSPSLVTPTLGTPASGNLGNCTNVSLTTGVAGTLPVANGGTGVTTSTGTGSVVRATSPSLVTPNLGTPSAGTLSNCTGLPLATGVSGTLPVANGGTGAATLAANSVLLGNGTSAVQTVAPGASGNVLISNGTTWTSSSLPTQSTSSSAAGKTTTLTLGAGTWTVSAWFRYYTGTAPATTLFIDGVTVDSVPNRGDPSGTMYVPLFGTASVSGGRTITIEATGGTTDDNRIMAVATKA